MVSIKSSYLITYQFLSIPVNIMRKYVTIWTAGVRIRIIIELMENFLTDKIIVLSEALSLSTKKVELVPRSHPFLQEGEKSTN